MLKKVIIFIFLVTVGVKCFSQIPVTINQKYVDSIYFQSKTIWITLTPFFIVNKQFSPDQGQTWLKVGMFGGNVKPFLQNDSIARHNLNIYKFTRAAGLLQMWVIAPLLAYKHFTYEGVTTSTGNDILDNNITQEEQSGYLATSIIVFLTGTFTYHVLAKTYLARALHDYNGLLNQNSTLNLSLKLDKRTQTPQLTLVWTF